MKKYFFIIVFLIAAWLLFHHSKANWQGQLALDNPIQSSDNLPSAWNYKDFTITPRAQYHIKAIILSKHYYWGDVEIEDTISKYDLALGWGPMSDGAVINQMNITQGSRWYNYAWSKTPPIDVADIISHSSNHHIIAANQDILDIISHFKIYQLVEMEGYLVDIQNFQKNWYWHTSLSRFDTGGGACKIFWVTSAFSIN